MNSTPTPELAGPRVNVTPSQPARSGNEGGTNARTTRLRESPATSGTRPVLGTRSIPITSGDLPPHSPSFGHRLERLADGRLLLWCNAHPLAEWSTDVTGDPNLDDPDGSSMKPGVQNSQPERETDPEPVSASVTDDGVQPDPDELVAFVTDTAGNRSIVDRRSGQTVITYKADGTTSVPKYDDTGHLLRVDHYDQQRRQVCSEIPIPDQWGRG